MVFQCRAGTLLDVRPLLCALALCSLAAVAGAQRRDGVYRPSNAPPATWQIDERHALVWNGVPYLPVGLRLDGSLASIAAAKEAGATDVLVELPAGGMGWEAALAALETAGMRYLIAVSSLAPMAKGIAVEPQGYRVSGIVEPRTVTVELPGATSALVVLASRRDSTIQRSERVPIVNGRLTYEVKRTGVEHVLLIYPEMASLELPDLWEEMDAHRDALLASLKRHPTGPGLRGFVNPLGRTLALPGREMRFIPTSPYFRMELAAQLESRYKNIETALRSWSMSSSDIDDFDHLARLVPLWSTTRGVSVLWDPKVDKLYPCDSRRSVAWRDIGDAVHSAVERRYARMVAAIRGAADVPVVQEWMGWSAPYEQRTSPVDGIGIRTAGTTPSAVLEGASRAASSILRWDTRGWLLGTDVDAGTGEAALVPNVVEDLFAVGAGGAFLRCAAAETNMAISAVAPRRAASAGSDSPRPVFFPENALNPAVPQRLPGGQWWLPAPLSGNRIDFGTGYFGYRLPESVAIWARSGPQRVKLRMVEPKKATFEAVDGSDPKPKVVKGGVEVTLTEYPLLIQGIDEIPIPEPAFKETVARFAALIISADVLKRDTTEDRVFFKDHVAGFERNPGGSFALLRRSLEKLAYKVGRFAWIEAEASREHTFSEVLPSPGCSSEAVLSLRTQIAPESKDYWANYTVPVRTQADQELWIAARIPANRRKDVQAIIGGQTMTIAEGPFSPYGEGFAWYRLGKTRLAGGSSTIRIRVVGAQGADMALDVLLLTPDSFVPSGVTMPDPIDFSLPPPKKKG